MPRGRKQHVRVMSEADEIVRRLRETGVTVTGLMKEYRCGHRVLVRSVLSRMTRAQYRAVGTIVVRAGKLRSHYKCSRRRESSRWIKVRDAGPLQGRYIPYARYLWEQAHGPVPEGWFVVHANNRSMDDRMENLVLVDCRANGRRLWTRPEVQARRIEALRRALAQRRREGGAARQWSKGQKRRSRVIWECVVCGADAEAVMVRCPKCGSEAIVQTRIRPMPAGMELQEVGT